MMTVFVVIAPARWPRCSRCSFVRSTCGAARASFSRRPQPRCRSRSSGRADWLSLLFAGIVSVISFLATVFSTGMYSVDWGRGRAMWTRKSVYFVLLGTFWSAMLLVVLATNFGVLWFGIAATTLATAFLVGFSGDATALEAAWKYLVLCSVGIGLALLGIVLLGRVSLELGLDPAHALAWSAIAQHHFRRPCRRPRLRRRSC